MSTRREFMVGTAVAAGALLVDQPVNAARMASTEPRLLLLDLELADAHRVAAEAEAVGCRALAITGDRVRFGREVFASGAPEIIGGLTTYADYIMLSGCAAEAGYRVLSERAQDAFVRWKIARLCRAICSG
jgi:hypothetical protein